MKPSKIVMLSKWSCYEDKIFVSSKNSYGIECGRNKKKWLNRIECDIRTVDVCVNNVGD